MIDVSPNISTFSVNDLNTKQKRDYQSSRANCWQLYCRVGIQGLGSSSVTQTHHRCNMHLGHPISFPRDLGQANDVNIKLMSLVFCQHE